jgi:hypothetical protein
LGRPITREERGELGFVLESYSSRSLERCLFLVQFHESDVVCVTTTLQLNRLLRGVDPALLKVFFVFVFFDFGGK